MHSGGNASNMFAYFSGADVALSISMTAVSTLASVAVILATFPEADQDALLKLPFLYAMTALCIGTIATLTYRRFRSA
jgi:hypothetical protein